MLNKAYFTGVDGGGTYSRALVMDAQGCVICHLQGEGSNVYKLGVEQATENLAEIIKRIESEIPDYSSYGAAICCGLAGVVEGQVQPELREAIRNLGVGESVHVHNDAYLSCYGVAEGEPGIALISGTGSAVFAFDRKGQVVTAGGMGYLYGDEGSGFDIGSRGIRAAVAYAQKRGPETALLQALLDEYGLKDVSNLPAKVSTPLSVSRFAETVHNLAVSGDSEAIRVIDLAARELIDLVLSVLARSDLGEAENLRVGLFGGCLANMGLLSSQVIEQLGKMELVVRRDIPGPELVAAEIARVGYLGASERHGSPTNKYGRA